jgi:hypothetical protein
VSATNTLRQRSTRRKPESALWHFNSLRFDHPQHERLYLDAEIDCVGLLGDFEPEEYAADPFGFFVAEFRRRYPERWAADSVPILWSVLPVYEFAPFSHMIAESDAASWKKGEDWLQQDFLTFYTWPVDDLGDRLDWFQLPVRLSDFPGFEESVGWKPAPMQPTAALRSMWESRSGVRQPRQRDGQRVR